MYRALLLLSIILVPSTTSFAVPQSTQPAPQSLSNSSILILPIESPLGSFAWVGRAIQQDMLVDLTQMTKAHVLAPSSAPAADADAALRAARDASAHYVVFGSAQSSGSQLRVTGQLLDVGTGQNLANLKATAPADDLFPLEDALSIQVARALPGATVPATLPAGAGAATPQPLPTIVNQQPYISEVTPAPQYDTTGGASYGYYGYGSYPYAYPYYPYSYYPYYYPYLGFYWGTGVIITGHHFHDFHDHGHFDHNHGFNNVNHGFNNVNHHGFDHRPFVSPHVNPGIYSRGFAAHGAVRGPSGFGAMRGGGAPRGMGAVPGGMGAARGGGAMAGHVGGGGMHGR